MIPYPIYQQPQQQAPQFSATPFPGMPNYGQPNYGQPTSPQPNPQSVAGQPFSQPYMPAQIPAGSGGWQPNPVLAAQALATNQPRVRGYAPDPTPTAAPPMPAPPTVLRLPGPDDLGVGHATPAAPIAPAAVVDWNLAHARMRELGVIRFGMTRVAGGVQVSMELPGGRVIDGVGASDAAALASAFERAAK